uniref:Uncharacterized protein AlNc14C23G2349 n=1 Tax=Albugo laibachii Nc14 TaxID=890382 RepID=F0W648_9STRA|nr:conserved hypothetical protein [Albugo laibachii Nc14]|eukprot:CCA16590.1 conserved hypothetical protein [Albugo laibachii Nc14]
MGASLVLENDTPNQWHCNVGADTKALQISYFVAAGIATFSAIFGLFGFYAPVVIRMANSNIEPLAVSGIAFDTIVRTSFFIEMGGFLASTFAAATTFGLFVVRTAEASFVKHQFELIPPGHSHIYKMRPLRWREGTCSRVFEFNASTVRTETLSLKPIFSGLPHHNRTHKISHWIEKRPPTHEDIIAITGFTSDSNKSVSIKVMFAGNTPPHVSTIHIQTDNGNTTAAAPLTNSASDPQLNSTSVPTISTS